MTLRSKRVVKYHRTSQKNVLESISEEPIGKPIVEPVNSESIVKDVFVTLQSDILKALTWDKEEELRKRFLMN